MTMTRFIGPTVIAMATATADMGTRLIENQPIGLVSAVTIACFVGTACIWLEKQFRLRDATWSREVRDFSERMSRLEQKIEDLGWQGEGRERNQKRKT